MNDFEVYIIVVLIWKEKEGRVIKAQTASSRKEKLIYAHYCVTMCNNEEKTVDCQDCTVTQQLLTFIITYNNRQKEIKIMT